MLKNSKKHFNEIPLVIKKFAVKCLIMFIVWESLYHLVMIPLNQPDKWLTHSTAIVTAKVLAVIKADGPYTVMDVFDKQTGIDAGNAPVFKSLVLLNNRKIIGIANACNALELMVLYIGFLFCLPTTYKRAIVFSICGLIAIFALNILRCALIAWINLNGHHQLADMAHHYLFKLVMYLLIFAAWVWYSKKMQIEKS